jgi:acyl-CoA synthetase (AMP-forming)/AMP-acid ligase II
LGKLIGVIVLHNIGNRCNRLVAYIVPDPEQTLTTDELRRFLKQNLPDYMVPSAFVFLDILPLGRVFKLVVS